MSFGVVEAGEITVPAGFRIEPVDLAVGRDGSLYVSDDHGDRIYRVTYAPR